MIPSRCWSLSWLIGVQVWPLPEVTAGLEWTGRQIQQHGRTPRLCREGGLRPGHQVLLQRPRREGIPHVSNFHICTYLHLNSCCRYEANSLHPKGKQQLLDYWLTEWWHIGLHLAKLRSYNLLNPGFRWPEKAEAPVYDEQVFKTELFKVSKAVVKLWNVFDICF